MISTSGSRIRSAIARWSRRVGALLMAIAPIWMGLGIWMGVGGVAIAQDRTVNYNGTILQGRDMSETDYSGTTFVNANMRNVDFHGSMMAGAILTKG
ncbi:MAG: pentapeptide repeat-containing protein, partial [Cyanobacteria bacterium J06639_1]